MYDLHLERKPNEEDTLTSSKMEGKYPTWRAIIDTLAQSNRCFLWNGEYISLRKLPAGLWTHFSMCICANFKLKKNCHINFAFSLIWSFLSIHGFCLVYIFAKSIANFKQLTVELIKNKLQKDIEIDLQTWNEYLIKNVTEIQIEHMLVEAYIKLTHVTYAANGQFIFLLIFILKL